MNYRDWTAERQATCEAANNQCQGCPEPHYLPFSFEGHAHHIFGRGGGRKDDRRLRPLQTIESEPNLARWRWMVCLKWACFFGHERLEKMSTKAYRQSLKDNTCSCGLLLI